MTTQIHQAPAPPPGSDVMSALRQAVPGPGQPARMLPALAYTSPEVLAWERRHLLAGSWTCLGRLTELLPAATGEDGRPTTQSAVMVGDVPALLVRDEERLRMFANTCRACAVTSSPPTRPPASSTGTTPETNRRSPARTASV